MFDIAGCLNPAAALQEWDAITLLGHGQTPLNAAPPACYRAMTEAVSLMEPATGVRSGKAGAGSTASRVALSRRQLAGVMAVLSAVALVLAVVATAHMCGGKCFQRHKHRSVMPLPFQSRRRTLSKGSLAGAADASSGGQAPHYLEMEQA